VIKFVQVAAVGEANFFTLARKKFKKCHQVNALSRRRELNWKRVRQSGGVNEMELKIVVDG
jgi:hypothetical protein